ncbi:MAG TPA: hypothetical protein DHW82_09590 [Spirochaetia bacterium]|nr:hypothetical protein [Spirochaetia bacterium]
MGIEGRERDLVLNPGEYAYVSDQTKGNINIYVGPNKTSLANTDQPVEFAPVEKRFIKTSLEQATKVFSTAPKGWYIQLKNPSHDGKQPETGKVSSLIDLRVGDKINIPGPVHFALWPGQMVKIIKGHHLRSNQYLVVRVYDEEAARENWKKAVIKPQAAVTEDVEKTGKKKKIEEESTIEIVHTGETPVDFTTGKLFVIKGTDVSFYIPPTGIEVVPDENHNYVREAVSLERLEYCILLSEDGNKKYIRGEKVVFPSPTENFVQKNNSRKFRAIELNEISGIYVKIIKPYEENNKKYKEGDELFITGKEQMIYFPRPEHAIVKYGDDEIHYAIAIPAGEGRYVLDRRTGKVFIKKGECMFLPDPRHEVILRRILADKAVRLYYPGNEEALRYNKRLNDITESKKDNFVTDDVFQSAKKQRESMSPQMVKESSKESMFGDDFNRKNKFTPPRMLTLDTKYEGAITINIWTGYAVQVVSKTGDRKVIQGPATYLLEYDEYLEGLKLSKGKPKSTDDVLETVYLRVKNNIVSDMIWVETKDLCEVQLELSYRVLFEGESNKWFEVENYVQFLSDHLRSKIRNAVKHYGIQEFHNDYINIIRDTVLGVQENEGKRPGLFFNENGMKIYDVEVLNIVISDHSIRDMLVDNQHFAVKNAILVSKESKNLETIKVQEQIKQEVTSTRLKTFQLEGSVELEKIKSDYSVSLERILSQIKQEKEKNQAKLEEQAVLSQISASELERAKNREGLQLEITQKKLELEILKVKAFAEAEVSKTNAIQPELVAALTTLGDKELIKSISEHLAPLAIVKGQSLGNVLLEFFDGTPIAGMLKKIDSGQLLSK